MYRMDKRLLLLQDKNNKIVDSWNPSYENYQSIVPETWSEAIFKFCKTAWENDPRNKNK